MFYVILILYIYSWNEFINFAIFLNVSKDFFFSMKKENELKVLDNFLVILSN